MMEFRDFFAIEGGCNSNGDPIVLLRFSEKVSDVRLTLEKVQFVISGLQSAAAIAQQASRAARSAK